MLSKKSRGKPSGIRPGDEYESFGGSPIKPIKKRSSKKRLKLNGLDTPSHDHGFDSFGGSLSSSGTLTNAFGDEITDYDIKVAYEALYGLSDDKTVTMEQFTKWINEYMYLNWDPSRIKRVFTFLDQDKAKVITFREFKQGLKSTNSDVILFYSNLMVRTLRLYACDIARNLIILSAPLSVYNTNN